MYTYACTHKYRLYLYVYVIECKAYLHKAILYGTFQSRHTITYTQRQFFFIVMPLFSPIYLKLSPEIGIK